MHLDENNMYSFDQFKKSKTVVVRINDQKSLVHMHV